MGFQERGAISPLVTRLYALSARRNKKGLRSKMVCAHRHFNAQMKSFSFRIRPKSYLRDQQRYYLRVEVDSVSHLSLIREAICILHCQNLCSLLYHTAARASALNTTLHSSPTFKSCFANSTMSSSRPETVRPSNLYCSRLLVVCCTCARPVHTAVQPVQLRCRVRPAARRRGETPRGRFLVGECWATSRRHSALLLMHVP